MSETLTAFLKGKEALAPSALFLTVSPRAVVLYLLIRSLGETRDTYRSKTSIAEALGWDRKTVFKFAKELEGAGWLTRKSEKKNARWRSTWSVNTGPTERDRSQATGPPTWDRTSPTKRDDPRPTDWDKNTPPLPTKHPTQELTPPSQAPRPSENLGGLSSQSPREEKKDPYDLPILSAADCWEALPGPDKQAAVNGAGELQDALAQILGRDRLPAPRASIVVAFWDWISSRGRIAGAGSLEAILVSRAKGGDAEVDAAAYLDRAARLDRQRSLRAVRLAQEDAEAKEREETLARERNLPPDPKLDRLIRRYTYTAQEAREAT